jgi:endonuclease-3
VLGEVPRRPGALPLSNRRDPLDELIYIVITTMTQYGAKSTFNAVKLAFPKWQDLCNRRAETRLGRLLQKSGLSNQKSHQLVALAKQLNRDFGAVTLDPLKQMDDATAEAYLLGLPRVGKKVARCVLMYSLGRDVLPVDAHVLRVSKRLQLLPASLPWAKAHDAIHQVVQKRHRYAMHVALVRHGRSICSARAPKCSDCPLMPSGICKWVETTVGAPR